MNEEHAHANEAVEAVERSMRGAWLRGDIEDRIATTIEDWTERISVFLSHPQLRRTEHKLALNCFKVFLDARIWCSGSAGTLGVGSFPGHCSQSFSPSPLSSVLSELASGLFYAKARR